jgi:hypothetical protein
MPSPNNNNNTNKENKSPFKPTKSTSTTTTPNASKISTSEIINAANRMIIKRESKQNLNTRLSGSASVPSATGSDVVASCQPETVNACTSFNDIKKKFENMSNQQQQQQPSIPLTPKSIIKKFEDLSSGSATCMAPRSNSNSTSNLAMSAPVSANVNFNNTQRQTSFKTSTLLSNMNNNNTSASIVTDRITPKSIISKFEMLLAQNNNANETPKVPCVQTLCPEPNPNNINQACRKKQRKNNEFKRKSPSPSSSQCTVATTSLTIVSSMAVSPNFNDFEEDGVVGDEDDVNSSSYEDQNAIYEELNTNNSEDTNAIKDGTSLFEYTQTNENEEEEEVESENDDTTTINTQTFDTQETYSLSSDYTGSFMNQDEFTDLNDGEDDDDYTYDEEMQGTECENEETTTTTTTTTATFDQTSSDTCSTLYCSSHIVDDIVATEPVVQHLKQQVSSSNLIDAEPLFSIKEYRRQKRRNNGRRSSVMPRQSLSTNKEAMANKAAAASKAKAAAISNANQCQVDDQHKKTKYLERIKVNMVVFFFY